MEVQLQTCFTLSLSFSCSAASCFLSSCALPLLSNGNNNAEYSSDYNTNPSSSSFHRQEIAAFTNIKDRQTKSVNHKKVGDNDDDGIGKGAYCLFALPINGCARAGVFLDNLSYIYDERRGTALLMPSGSTGAKGGRAALTDERNRTRKLSIKWVYFYPPCNKSHEMRIAFPPPPPPQSDVDYKTTMLLLMFNGHWIDFYLTGKLSGNGCEF